MRVLVTVENSSKQRFLIRLESEEATRDVKELLAKSKREKAIKAAIKKGTFERKVTEEEIRHIEADMLLTKYGAYWNL